MTGYQSKRKAASAKTIDEVNWLDHEPDGRRVAQEPMCPECKAGVLYECVACSSNNYPPKPAQRPWVDLTGNEWFEWWRVSKVTDATQAEIDFADFLIIAQAVMTKLKEDNK